MLSFLLVSKSHWKLFFFSFFAEAIFHFVPLWIHPFCVSFRKLEEHFKTDLTAKKEFIAESVDALLARRDSQIEEKKSKKAQKSAELKSEKKSEEKKKPVHVEVSL